MANDKKMILGRIGVYRPGCEILYSKWLPFYECFDYFQTILKETQERDGKAYVYGAGKPWEMKRHNQEPDPDKLKAFAGYVVFTQSDGETSKKVVFLSSQIPSLIFSLI